MIEKLKTRIVDAMKNKRTTELGILRVALGDIQTQVARSKTEVTEDQMYSVIKKIIKSNTETLSACPTEKAEVLKQENEILGEFLPKTWTTEQIYAYLTLHALSPIQQAKSDGQATGLAVKELKSAEAVVDGKEVALVVKQIREEYHK